MSVSDNIFFYVETLAYYNTQLTKIHGRIDVPKTSSLNKVKNVVANELKIPIESVLGLVWDGTKISDFIESFQIKNNS